MNLTFLEKITAEAREHVAAARSNGYLPKLTRIAEENAERRRKNAFFDALSDKTSVNIIAEIKRASPSKGVIKSNVDPASLARRYAAGGAAAISVLTEPNHFGGSMSDLVKVARSVDLPILRKDFIVDEYQIIEAAAGGASAILLIVAALPEGRLRSLHRSAVEYGLDVLVEIHNSEELEIAADIGAAIIGVNNRDLHSLEVSLDVSRLLIAERPVNALMIAESGISTRDEIDELRALGFDGFLIGETLMRSGDVVNELGELTA
ncbi:MAG: indole-3-glycerol phosphate synthase TrpC [Pyrinomonadaceae bacterium]